MGKLLLVFITVIGFYPAISQEGFKISLAGQKIDPASISFWVDEIIDTRIDKSNIGFVQRGMSNKMHDANFENQFDKELLHLIHANSLPDDNYYKVAIRINHFHISEKTGFSSESAFIEISGDFLAKESDKYYFVKSFQVSKQVKGLDVTAKHPKNIASALEEMLSKIKKDEVKNSLTNSSINQDSIKINPLVVKNKQLLEQYQFPFLTEKMNEGFYASFFDFRNNRPVSGPNIYVVKKTPVKKNDVIEVIPYYSETNKKIKDDYWGFCLGDTIYIQADKRYFPLEFDGITYTFNGYRGSDPNFLNPSAGAIATAGLLGGAIGGAIVAGSVNADYLKPVKYSIDPFTGNFSGKPLTDISQSTSFSAKSKIVVVRYPKGQIDEEISVTISDTTVLRIGVNDYEELDLNGPFSPTRICIDSLECLEFLPSDNEIKYFTVIYDLHKGAERKKIVEVARDIGADFVSAAKRKAKKSAGN